MLSHNFSLAASHMVLFQQLKAQHAVDAALSRLLPNLTRWLNSMRQRTRRSLKNFALKHCEETRRSLDAFLDNELDPLKALEIERHLQVCAVCAQTYETQRAAGKLAKALPRYQAPAVLRERILLALRASEESGPLPSISS
ncbi:MAG: zf-HC2 domain-containing protein [Chthoniobacterales bacterium]|nr:zf-HC2 domain-containing protein [Chthoniobacterales bacterium]